MNTEEKYIEVLTRELVPAMGCTEPISIAYAGAIAKDVLGEEVCRAEVLASGNMIKNVKSVVVPNTDGKKGIQVALAAGIVAGDHKNGLQVIANVTDAQKQEIAAFLERVPIQLNQLQGDCALDFVVRVQGANHSAMVRIRNTHENVVFIQRDNEVLKQTETEKEQKQQALSLDLEEIYEFATTVSLDKVRAVLERQISCNTAIAKEGMTGRYGAAIGKILYEQRPDDLATYAKALAAAGSDARMSGCELPVIINSGSGNQGMCASLPVLAYAERLGASEETKLRALLISNLVTLYQKQFIGRLSAYCGAVSAGAGAGAGITYLQGGDFEHICHTVVNALAITSGIFCDGAKPSCAAKIAAAVDAGILGYEMYRQGKQFYRGEGIVGSSVADTMLGIGRIACEGMRACDDSIIQWMMAHAEV